MNLTKPDLADLYPRCRRLLGPRRWRRLALRPGLAGSPERLPELVGTAGRRGSLPGFLADLARLERGLWQTREKRLSLPESPEAPLLNPTLSLLELQWRHLAGPAAAPAPEAGREQVLIWKHPATGEVRSRAASPEDLLILKLVSEGIDRTAVAREGGWPVAAVDAAVESAVGQGLVIAPPSRIRRDFPLAAAAACARNPFLVSPSFTLQWHVTQACDLNCRHCYDRSDRTPLTLGRARIVLDDLAAFCRERHVRGRISFTGGNPLLHPDFAEIYAAAAERGFALAILGNPVAAERIAPLTAIAAPEFFQVSLEGLPPYNDFIRGAGHFARTMAFLETLRERGVYSMVMLTLSRGNLADVLPLGEVLRGRADLFHFNRLSRFGQGAALDLPSRREYESFLAGYLAACADNPVLGLKENLINVLLERRGAEPFGGCTGFGCGAAFNFVALLPDGEVHACRKFPSAIGNIFAQGLAEIYDSEMAQRYRSGAGECRACRLRPVCGGCLASAYSCGLDPLVSRDPLCFLYGERTEDQ